MTVFARAEALAAAPAGVESSAHAGARPATMKPNPARATSVKEESDSEEEYTRFTAAFLCWGERGRPGTDRLPIVCTISSKWGRCHQMFSPRERITGQFLLRAVADAGTQCTAHRPHPAVRSITVLYAVMPDMVISGEESGEGGREKTCRGESCAIEPTRATNMSGGRYNKRRIEPGSSNPRES